MGIVFAAIAPHGGIAIAEACDEGEEDLALATRHGMEELGRLLQAHYGVARVVTYRKISQSLPTPAEVLDQLARTCDALIHAVAD